MTHATHVVRRIAVLTLLLLGVDFLDELWSGVPYVGAPGIRSEFGLDYTAVAGFLLVIPGLVALFVEPPIFVLADRFPRRRFVTAGLAVLGVAGLVAGLAPNVWVLLAALCVAFPASGVGVNLAQASLMDANPDRREQYMTRWAFLGSIGDLLTPALFFALAVFGWGWREAFGVCAAVLVIYAAVLSRQRFPPQTRPDDEPAPPLLVAVRAALGNRRLLLWLGGVSLCALLDEILVAFGALHLRDTLGAGVGARSVVLMCEMVGALLGLVVLDRLLARFEPLRLLRWSAALCLITYVMWVFAPDLVWSAGLFFLTGLFTAPLYPIAMAQAYRALPEQSGMVNAVSTLLGPVGIAAPLVLGLVADAFGLVPALLLLTVQPAGLFVLALRRPRSASAPPPTGQDWM